jgi:prepilin-type N-terminal cleavage/methylation domain-containing protein
MFEATNLKYKGFTLSELLVSLGVLGLIAGLTIPSIVNSVESSKKRAIFKEDIQILSQVFTDMVQSGYGQNISIVANLTPKLNATKVCDTDIVAQGCMKTAPTGLSYGDSVGFLMPNKSVILFPKNYTTTPDMMWFYLDFNGENTLSRVNPIGMTGDTMVLEWNLRDVRAERHSGWSGFLNPTLPSRGSSLPVARALLLTSGMF